MINFIKEIWKEIKAINASYHQITDVQNAYLKQAQVLLEYLDLIAAEEKPVPLYLREKIQQVAKNLEDIVGSSPSSRRHEMAMRQFLKRA